ncbi:MAG: hypothetical protein ACHQIL_00045 [Steroidobacterales bacterium]
MRALKGLLAVAALALNAQSLAASGSVSVSPSVLSASLQSTLPTPLTWTVKLPGIGLTNGAPLLNLSSPQATVSTTSGQVLQTVPTVLTVHLGATGQGTATELFTLSPATISAALRLGAGSLLLTRTFGVPPYGAVGTAVISLAGSGGGPLALSRVALHFEDRSLVRVLRAGESAVAIAEINYSGGGVLNGLWEVASPPSTQGQPVFVPFASASVNLGEGGLTEVTSPALPTAAEGNYYVRFSVRTPLVPFEGLVLRYAVESAEPEALPITVIRPVEHATLHADTRFEWRPTPGAIAYRLEFYAGDAAPGDEHPIAGQWVTSAQRDAVLSILAQTHLQSTQLYRWRIIALDADSHVVGRSALYEIVTP